MTAVPEASEMFDHRAADPEALLQLHLTQRLR